MKLIEKYLPNYQFTETHSIIINSSQENCYKEMFQLDLSQSWIIRNLFELRGLPSSAQELSRFADGMNFTLLEENKFFEFIYGFKVKNSIERINNKKSFIENDLGYSYKAVWNFEFDKILKDKTKILKFKNTRKMKFLRTKK